MQVTLIVMPGDMECSELLVCIYTVREQLNLIVCCWSWCM